MYAVWDMFALAEEKVPAKPAWRMIEWRVDGKPQDQVMMV